MTSIIRHTTRGLAALCVLAAGWAAADAREVHVKGVFSFLAVGKTYTVENGRSYFVGEFSGSYIDESGSGPFHLATITCPGFNDVGLAAGGYCTARDLAGDQLFISWSCGPADATPPAGAILSAGCQLDWHGGTGKFQSVSAKAPYQAVIVNVNPDGTAAGYVLYDHIVTMD